MEWLVVIAKQNQDYLAARGLREQEFADVYLPKMFRKARTDLGSQPVASLLLSPYFFVLCDVTRGEHGPIKNTRGVQDLLCDTLGNPKALKNGFRLIADMRSAEDEEMNGASIKPVRTDLVRGMLVRIDKPGLLTRTIDGDVELIVGRITIIRKHRVVVLAGNVPFEVDEKDVTPLS